MEKINKAFLLAPLLGLAACSSPNERFEYGQERFQEGKGYGYDEAVCHAAPYLDTETLTADVERAYVLGENARHEQLSRLRNQTLICNRSRNRNQ